VKPDSRRPMPAQLFPSDSQVPDLGISRETAIFGMMATVTGKITERKAMLQYHQFELVISGADAGFLSRG